MKNFKKVISVLLVFALVFTSMITFTAKTTDAKVKSIKVAKKATIVVGQKKTFKVKIKTTKKTSKKFTVKASKKNIVKVKKKGKKITVTGLNPGKVTLTVKSKANKKKKKKITITVKSNDATLNITPRKSYVFTLAFSKKVNITKNNIVIKAKKMKTGKYLRELKIDDLNTDDSKNFVLTTEDYVSNGTMLQFTVKGVNKSNIVKELEMYRLPKDRTSERIITLKTSQSFSSTYNAGYYVDEGYGRLKSYSGVPTGLRVENKETYFKISGKVSNTGIFTSYFYFEDEKETVYTLKLIFVVGSDDKLTAYCPKQVRSVMKNEKTAYGYSTIYVAGGSGNYSYNITDYDSIFDSYMSSYYGEYNWYFYSDVAGTFKGRVTVYDDYDYTKTVNVVAEVEVKNASIISGKVTTKSGKPLEDAYVDIETSIYRDYDNDGYAYTDEKGEYKLYITPGTFDMYASYNDSYKYVFGRTINSNATQNFALNLFAVTLRSNNAKVPAALFGSWYNAEGESEGYGETLYLKPGSYNLNTSGAILPSTYTAKTYFTVAGSDLTAIATVTLSEPAQIYRGSTNLGLKGNWTYYKFVADADDYFYFSSSNNSGCPAAKLYDSNGNYLNGDSGSSYYYSGSNVSFNEYLTDGDTYYLAVRDKYGDNNSCTVNIAIIN